MTEASASEQERLLCESSRYRIRILTNARLVKNVLVSFDGIDNILSRDGAKTIFRHGRYLEHHLGLLSAS